MSCRNQMILSSLSRKVLAAGLVMISLAGQPLPAAPAVSPNPDYQLFARSNLVAWCIVPFDSKKRGPEARAEMLERLGFKLFAYDYRAEHVPTFDAEVEALTRHHVELFAWWFPGTLNDEARLILDVLKRHHIRAQLWVMGGGAMPKTTAEHEALVTAEVKRLQPIAEAAAQIGCTVALYNHGSWFGEPENQIEIIERLKAVGISNVGIVYNLHHGHEHLGRFGALLRLMKPHLVALNLNGMMRDGEQRGQKIMPIGQGDIDLHLLRAIRDSGWRGPVGILNHTDEDAEARLQDNLDGLDWLVPQLDGLPAGAKPTPRSWKAPAPTRTAAASGEPSLSAAFGMALRGSVLVTGRNDFRQRPLTVECRARLDDASNFNILVAADPKSSADHWELYSYAGSGVLSLYQPGRGGEVVSGVNICDGQWHSLAAIIEAERVRLFVDGKMVKESPAQPRPVDAAAGDLAIGRLVEGGLGCSGLLDNVRISRGVREIAGVPERPLEKDAATLGLWNFDELSAATGKPDFWAVESAEERAALPEFKVIPAALPSQLTPANGFPKRETFLTWHRSHGDSGGTRYSALDQINRQNVTNLQVAWTYHSRDGSNAIQCNPIIVNGLMFAPTPGRHLVAVNAATGEEVWRFKPEGRPAFRGLIYRPGQDGVSERVMFCAGKYLYALDPKSGQPIKSFGQDGKTTLPGVSSDHFGAATAGPTIFERTIVVPGFEKDVWGFDVVTGEQRWTFHTVPQPGEYGYDTWGQTETYGANCWAGMAMDDQRGIAYITTGSPKKNFIGVGNPGDNLFGNCVIALDARTGQRLWHFQEIRHDIWDLDIPAPPNLTTIVHDGKRVDVVAVVTKIANTLLLDRVTGKPIFPFRLRRAPTSDLRGETTSPYQPDPELPERFSKKEFTAADLTDRTEEAADFALTRFKSATTGWFRPGSEGRANLFFNIDGGGEWTGSCVDPDTGHLYVTANHMGWLISIFRNDDPPDDPKAPRTRGQTVFETTCASCHATNRLGIGVAPPLRGIRHRLSDEQVTNQIRTGRNGMPAVPESQLSADDLKALLDFIMLRDRPMPVNSKQSERPVYSFTGYPRFVDHEGYPANKPPWGTLNCLDLNSGKLLWKVPLGEFPKLAAQGVPKTGTENYGGAIVTAGGLVFCAGTIDSKIRAFDKVTGEEVWSASLPWVGNAPPATYQVDGRQFVVIAATGSKLGTSFGDAYVAFALPPTRR